MLWLRVYHLRGLLWYSSKMSAGMTHLRGFTVAIVREFGLALASVEQDEFRFSIYKIRSRRHAVSRTRITR